MCTLYFRYFRKSKRIANALIRLRVCADWSEHLLAANTTLLEISCHGSFVLLYLGRWKCYGNFHLKRINGIVCIANILPKQMKLNRV